MAFAEDLDGYFADFAVTATIGAASVPVIFDREHVDTMGAFAGGIDATSPSALMKTADVAANSVARNTVLVIGGTTYYAQRQMPDGTGLTRVMLSLEAA